MRRPRGARGLPRGLRPTVVRLAAGWAALALFFVPARGRAAFTDDVTLSGYARENPILWLSAPALTGDGRYAVNLLHLRQNLRWYAVPPVTVALEVKERLLFGDRSGELAGLIAAAPSGLPYFDWTASSDGGDGYAEASIDRLWVDFAAGDLELRAGRQRVAWGTNLVWNPIDVFNPSSSLDFDNEEKPGTDAVRVQYYFGPASEIDAAWAPGRESADTDAAARIKVNGWGYDWGLLVGRRAADHVAGVSWTGSVAGGGFRGEALFGRPREGPDRTGRQYANASISGDYTFPNTLYVQISALYQSRGTTGDGGGASLLDAAARRDLSPGRWAVFGEVAKDLTPLWRGDLSAIVNPCDGSAYIGPTLTWSAAPNLDVAAQALLFGGRAGTEFGGRGRIWMIRAKYSF